MNALPHLKSLEWNHQDELVRVKLDLSGNLVHYNYDGGGQRTRKIITKNGLKQKERLYLGLVERYQEYDNNGVVTLERWTLQVEGLAQVDTLTVHHAIGLASPTPVARYQYRDRLGSSVIEANEQGQVISYEEYYPYGSSAYQAAASGVNLSLKRYRFTGKERDEETGLDYFGVRYYASWLGRWTSGDPGGFVDGLNLYQYTRNNPVNGIDSEGYSTEPVQDPRPIKKEEKINTIQSNDPLGDAGDEIVVVAKPIEEGLAIDDTLEKTKDQELIISVKTSYDQGIVIDPNLEEDALMDNPEYQALTTFILRRQVSAVRPNLYWKKVNISAGNALEFAYGEFTGLQQGRNIPSYVGDGTWNQIFNMKTVRPDFIHPTTISDHRRSVIYLYGGAVEVKAIQYPVTLKTNNNQIDAEINVVRHAKPWSVFGEDAGTNRAASFTLAVTAGTEIDRKLIEEAENRGVNLYVQYAYQNIKTGKVVFSNPERLNNVGNEDPSAAGPQNGNIFAGGDLQIQRAISKWK